ncbi:MAG: hypothetical protein Q9225_001815 [Loekoesia sp. 1 TL-2023]
MQCLGHRTFETPVLLSVTARIYNVFTATRHHVTHAPLLRLSTGHPELPGRTIDSDIIHAGHDDSYVPFDRSGMAEQRLECGPTRTSKPHHTRRPGKTFRPAEMTLAVAPTPWANTKIEYPENPNSHSKGLASTRESIDLPIAHPTSTLDSSTIKSTKPSTLQSEPTLFVESNNTPTRTPSDPNTRSVAQRSNARRPNRRQSSPEERSKFIRQKPPIAKRETWQIQKDALSSKFGSAGWAPRKRLSPDALEGVRALHAQYPEKYTTPILANYFEVSTEAIRRILKSKWRPNDKEVANRRQRWDKRGERIWSKMVALGVKPPKKWRENTSQVSSSKPTESQSRNDDSIREPRRENTAINNSPHPAKYSRHQSAVTSFTKGHRNANSPNCLQSTISAASELGLKDHVQHEEDTTARRHKRSVSIVSIGSDNAPSANKSLGISASTRNGKGHARAASLQILPIRYTASTKGRSPSIQPIESSASTQRYGQSPAHDRAATLPAMLRSYTSSTRNGIEAIHEPRTPAADPGINQNESRPHSRTPSTGFSSPPRDPKVLPSPGRTPKQARDVSTKDFSSATTQAQPAVQDQPNQTSEPPSYLARVFSPASKDGTPRSSRDIFSVSNTSSDTLASEYVNSENSRTIQQPIPQRRQSHLPSYKSRQAPETLMMGYGNIAGAFSLDPSLVNPNSFAEVRRKAVVGDQAGGGVVRAESTKPQGGLLGSFGWNALGESLGGLLGGSERSGSGETIGHDLMSPHVMLHSESSISPIKDLNKGVAAPIMVASQVQDRHPDQGFLSYVSHLLDTPRRESGVGLLSPSAAEAKSTMGPVEEPATVEGAITLAVQQSNSPTPSKLRANRFEIARSGNRVAVIMLARPAYRLGEVISLTVDFHKSDIQCYSLRVALETAERLDPTIALRSQASISRISRKVYATQHESSISADRLCFSLTIPSSSTPEFITSGVSLEWILRCEFVTDAQFDREDSYDENSDNLLEKITEDERGSVSAAIQTMSCETFEVQLPLRVYGDTRGFDDNFKVEECLI